MTRPDTTRRTTGSSRAADRDLADLAARRRVRVGLAAKNALPVSLLTAAIFTVFGFVMYSHFADGLDVEFDRTGVFAARLAATPEVDSWLERYNTVDDLRRRLADIEAEYAIAGSTVNLDGKSAATEEITRRLARYDENQRAFNKRRLEGLRGAEGALDVIVADSKDVIVATASGLSAAKFDVWHRAKVGATEIESCRFRPEGRPDV
ncbi:MAG TPA: hypothetical protein VEI02_09980, partial [Planctomycetota bacterium]|nr:hypothetical protein [Planctomycetota bacterium]